MTDVVVTVPKSVWFDWLEEGDLPGDPVTGEQWGFFVCGAQPPIGVGERVYVVSHGLLRGYSPLTRIQRTQFGWAFVREGGAVAITIPQPVVGFRSWRSRWWDRSTEVPFPDWRTAGVVAANREQRAILAHLVSKYPPAEVLCEDLFERLAVEDPERLVGLLAPGKLPPHLLTYAAEIAGKLAAEKVVPPLLVLLENESAVVREGALCGLQTHMDNNKVWSKVVDMWKKDPSEGVRSAARGVLEWREAPLPEGCKND
jgi:hypothetical protein